MQRTERCFGTTSATAVQLIVQYIKTRTLLATVLCWSPLTDQLFQDHDLLPITALSQWSQNDDLLHARLQTNPSSRSSEYIMVSNALGGVNGRSRAVILHLDVDQSQQISLPDYLDDAQGACNCCAWFLIKPTSYVVQIKKLTRSHSRD